jgi:MoxR-like ATPase
MLTCKECGHQEKDFLGDHLLEVHDLAADEYEAKYPGEAVASDRLRTRLSKRSTPQRAHPPKPEELTIDFAGITFPVNVGVPEDVCLPMPAEYRIPRHGELGQDLQHATVALRKGRSIYISGLPGSGKDAFLHALSNMCRWPALLRQVKPGTDIEAWMFTRAFNEQGTFWEEGDVLKALRDGYLTEDGRRIPYLLLVSDFDRADRAQAEYLRLITDSIQGRVDGPMGKNYRVLPGTVVVATANSTGAGDNRGRCVSANPIDASILDRFERKVQFHWMDWKDEGPIAKAKFPLLLSRVPKVFNQMQKVTETLRKAIHGEELYAEFSHRGLCSILGHAEDILDCAGSKKRVPKNLMKMAARMWLDGLPDEDTRTIAKNLMDPHLEGGVVEEGHLGHIKSGPVAKGWKS